MSVKISQTTEALNTIAGWIGRLIDECPGHKRKLKSAQKDLEDVLAHLRGEGEPAGTTTVVIHQRDDRILVIPPGIGTKFQGGTHHFKRAQALTFRLKTIEGYKWEGKDAQKASKERGSCSFPKEKAAAVKLALGEFFPGASVVDNNGNSHGVLPTVETVSV